MAVRLDGDRNKAFVFADIAHVRLDLPTDLLGELALIAHPQVESVLRRSVIRLAEVEARLALGQPSRQAAAPYLRIALRSALSPQIETTRATGLIFLPGAMTGLILAGVPPVQAVLVQAVVMFLILGSVAVTTVVVALGLVRLVFTRDHRLRPLASRQSTGSRR